MELIRCANALFENSLFNTIFHRKRRLSIGKGDMVSPFLQFLAETYNRVGGSGPLPIAEEMKDLQSDSPLRFALLIPSIKSRMPLATSSISDSFISGKKGRERIFRAYCSVRETSPFR